MRRDVLADDARRKRIGDRPFESIADFDADLLFFREDEEDQSVAVLLLTDAPLLRAANGEVLDRIAFERWQRVDDELRTALLLEVLELAIQRVGLSGIEQTGLVREPLGGGGWAVERGDRDGRKRD